MIVREARGVLDQLSASQWGMFTTAQAVARGVSRMDLSRLADAGSIHRVAHGVYRNAGAPGDDLDDLRAAWLSVEPQQLAYDRLSTRADGIVVGGASAALLHGMGDLPADVHQFISRTRRQTRRPEIRFMQRSLDDRDVTIVRGLPATTRERTLADLVESRVDLSLVADGFRDACRQSMLDVDRLTELLNPLAARNGFRRGDGRALLERLTEIAGLDAASFADRVARNPTLSRAVLAAILRRHPRLDAALGGSDVVWPDLVVQLSQHESIVDWDTSSQYEGELQDV